MATSLLYPMLTLKLMVLLSLLAFSGAQTQDEQELMDAPYAAGDPAGYAATQDELAQKAVEKAQTHGEGTVSSTTVSSKSQNSMNLRKASHLDDDELHSALGERKQGTVFG